MTGEPQARSFGRSAGTLSIGVGVAGLLTYVYFALASHNLDATAYGEIVVLWSATFVTISVLHRPVEQFISRTVAARRARGEPIGPTLREAARIEGAIVVAFAIVALALRGPLTDDLFSGSATIYWVYFAAVLAFAASFFARGYLAGEGRFGLLGGLLASESFSRMAFSLAVAIGIASGRDVVAAGVVAAPLFSLCVVPLAFGRGAQRAAPPAPAATAPQPGSERAAGGAFAAAVFVIMLSEQSFLNAGPLLIKASEGAAAAGYIFNVLMLARAPLLVFQGISTSLLPHLTRLRSGGATGAERAFDDSVATTLKAIAAFTALVGAVVAVAGPALMQAAFSDRFTYDRLGLLLVTAAMGLYLGATTLNQAALARGRARRAASCWGVCAVGFLAWCLSGALAPDRRIEVGFLAAAAALFGLLALLYRSAEVAGAGAGLTPEQETEARLALADEAS